MLGRLSRSRGRDIRMPVLTIDAAALPVSQPVPGLVVARSIETLASGLPTGSVLYSTRDKLGPRAPLVAHADAALLRAVGGDRGEPVGERRRALRDVAATVTEGESRSACGLVMMPFRRQP